MEIRKKLDGKTLTIALEGDLDTITSMQLEGQLRVDVSGIEELIIDMEKLSYITSAGLRVLQSTQRVMKKQGKMIIRNVNPEIMEVFEITGFDRFLNIE